MRDVAALIKQLQGQDCIRSAEELLDGCLGFLMTLTKV